MKTYTITSGEFRMDDGSIKRAGETIELPDDVARLHATKLQLLEPPAADHTAQAEHGQ